MGDAISEASQYFPVVTLTGPRQAGKYTLLRQMFPSLPYLSLEDPDVRLRADSDPRSFLMSHRTGMIIDEVQHLPKLLSYIQTIVDELPDSKFYLTGSSQFSLMKTVTQSLAGRTSVHEMLPLSISELAAVGDTQTSPDVYLYNGFYPAIWSGKNIPRLLYPNYVKTYLERDVRDLLAVKDLDLFQRFVRLCAARIGSVFVASELANELGISVNTVQSWLGALKASYIVYMLPPFFQNTRKRLTKSPKIYFTDCGLAAYLLEIESSERMNTDKMRGHLFENMIIMEFLKKRVNPGLPPNLYFYRDSNGVEVDLMVRSAAGYDCYEIKSSATFHSDFIKNLASFDKAFPGLALSRQVIYAGPDAAPVDGVAIHNYISALTAK